MQDRENDQILEKLAALGSRLDALEVRVSALTHEETLKTEAKVRNADVFKETSPTPAIPVAVAAPAISDSESPPPFRCPDWAGSNQEDSSNQAQAPQEPTAGAGTKPGIWSDPDFFGRFCHYLKDHLSIGMCLGGVAVLCFIFASALLIKMAIDNGWLTPIRQVWITGIFGAAMCATGYKLRARDKRYFALLSGGGIVVMYIAVYGGAIYHHLYEWPISILLGSLISLYTLWLFAKLRSDFFAVAALVGTYLVPLLLPDFARLQTESGIFYILWDVVFIALAIRLCDWKLLMTAAYMATIGLILSRFCTQEQLPFITTQTIQAILFGCGVLCVCKHKPSLLTPSRSWGYIPLMMLTYLSMTIAGTSVYKGWLPEAVIFFTIWNILYMVMAFRLAQWKFLLTAAYFALIAFHWQDIAFNASNHPGAGFILFQSLQMAAFLCVTAVLCFIHKFPLTATKTWFYFPLFLTFYFTQSYDLEALLPRATPWIAIAFAGCLCAIYIADKIRFGAFQNGGPVLRIIVLVIATDAVYFDLIPERWTPIYGIAALATLCVFAILKLKLLKAEILSTLLLVGVFALCYFTSLHFNLNDEFSYRNILFAGLFFVAILAVYLGSAHSRQAFEDAWIYLLFAAHLQIIAGIYHLATWLAGILSIQDFDRFILSTLWGIFALAILGYAMRNRDRILANSSLFILAIPTWKVFFYDMIGTPRIVRILSFTILGIVLYIGGILFRKIQHWKQDGMEPQTTPELAQK